MQNVSKSPAFDWDDARLVLLVTRLGSLKKAASALGVHVSTVSRRLDGLEHDLGLHLFDRTSDGVKPTAAVEKLLPFAEAMEQSALGMSHALEGFEAEPEGTVRLTAPPSFVEHFLLGFATELIHRYPKIRLELIGSIQYADLTRREADIAVRVRRPTTGDLLSVALMPDIPSHLFGASSQAFGRREFKDAAFVTYSRELAFVPECQWVLKHAAPEQIVLRANSLTAQVEAVRSGIGVTVLAEPYERLDMLHRIRLKPELAKTLAPIPGGSLFLVTHRALRQVPRIAATWALLRELFPGAAARV